MLKEPIADAGYPVLYFLALIRRAKTTTHSSGPTEASVAGPILTSDNHEMTLKDALILLGAYWEPEHPLSEEVEE